MQMYVGSSTVDLTRASAGSASDTGWVDSDDWATYGGASVNYGYRNGDGTGYYFARGSNGTGHTDGPASDWSGSIGMKYRYVESPEAPLILSVAASSDGTSATVTVSAPGDDGGSPVTGYRVQRATDPGFTTNLATVDSSGTVMLTGLTPGVRYYYRATARNAVTDAAVKLGGLWSATVGLTQPEATGLGRTRLGSSWPSADMKVRDSGNANWLDGDARRWSGSAWEELGS
jgi:hypothetical protein